MVIKLFLFFLALTGGRRRKYSVTYFSGKWKLNGFTLSFAEANTGGNDSRLTNLGLDWQLKPTDGLGYILEPPPPQKFFDVWRNKERERVGGKKGGMLLTQISRTNLLDDRLPSWRVKGKNRF